MSWMFMRANACFMYGQDEDVRRGFTVRDGGTPPCWRAIEEETSSMIDKHKATTTLSLEESLEARKTHAGALLPSCFCFHLRKKPVDEADAKEKPEHAFPRQRSWRGFQQWSTAKAQWIAIRTSWHLRSRERHHSSRPSVHSSLCQQACGTRFAVVTWRRLSLQGKRIERLLFVETTQRRHPGL